MISLDQALDRLLHRRSYREAFLAERHHELDLSPADLAALAAVDREQLRRAAERVRREILHRKHRGSGGLLTLFPRTIAAWREAHPADEELAGLLDAFLESEAFDRHRELPFAGLGLSLEEAFHRFCEAANVGDPAAREQEFLTAMMKALLSSPRPAFTLPPEIRPCPAGFFAIGRRGGVTLHAATRGRLVIGPLTPFLADLLTSGEPPAEVARRHGVAPGVLGAALRQLGSLGLVGGDAPDPA